MRYKRISVDYFKDFGKGLGLEKALLEKKVNS